MNDSSIQRYADSAWRNCEVGINSAEKETGRTMHVCGSRVIPCSHHPALCNNVDCGHPTRWLSLS